MTTPIETAPDGLRAALAEVLAVYDDVHGGKIGAAGSRERIYYGVSSDIRGILAAHPAEPAQPVVDRDALAIALHDSACPDRRCSPTAMGEYYTKADEILAILALMPGSAK